MKIEFLDSFDEVKNLIFEDFFVNWPKKPNIEIINILEKSTYFVVAKIENKAVGFITCLSDGIISAYIPLLEVLPEYQARGIGKQLVQKILKKLKNVYMIDLVCDLSLNPFYEKLGFIKYNSCIIRNKEAL